MFGPVTAGGACGMTTVSVSERLVAFMREWAARGVPDHAMHEATRLILNQLKASVGAADHPTVRILHDWAVAGGKGGEAHVLWLGTPTGAEQAAIVNGALFEVLDFNDTYIPCFMHAVSGVLPAVLAVAERGGPYRQTGADSPGPWGWKSNWRSPPS